MVLDYNNNVPNNKEFSMAQKPKTGVYKILNTNQIIKIIEWHDMYEDGCDPEWLAIVQPDWGDGVWVDLMEYEGKENSFFAEHGGFMQGTDGNWHANESMVECLSIQFLSTL